MKRLLKLLILLFLVEHAGTVVNELSPSGASYKHIKKTFSYVGEKVEKIVKELGFEPAQNASSA